MRALLEKYLKESRDIHLSHNFHLSGRLTDVGEELISLARDDALYHIPTDKIVYVFEKLSPDPD